jgi:hypothetical protein
VQFAVEVAIGEYEEHCPSSGRVADDRERVDA